MGRVILLLVALSLSACGRAIHTPDWTPTPSAPPTFTPKPPIAFPPDINPLTGQAVTDPSLLKIPALLLSVSNFPAIGRPQAGLSFAPFVYEIYITEGATRFLGVMYGEYPAPEIPKTGGCPVRTGAFAQTGILLGGRVWFDANGDGLRGPDEGGVEGTCVNLYDAGGQPLEQTATDTNGYYGFNVSPGRYFIQFVKPDGFEFTRLKAGAPEFDSDADLTSGLAEADAPSDVVSLDAGLVASAVPTATPPAPVYLPLAQVGPIRSGRLIYGYIADFFKDSCLIYAFASEEVLARLPQCFMVFHDLAGGGYMLNIPDLRNIAEENRQTKGSDFDYASNVFSEAPPPGGEPASKLNVYIAYLNQSGWTYDPLYRAYLRSVDTSEMADAGILHPDTDRLTGRQLHFENVIVLFAEHQVVSPTNLDIHLDQGKSGDALLFRDGRLFHIKWSTRAEDDRNRDRAQHPVVFLGPDGEPMPLKPGHTWVLVVTPDTTVKEKSTGIWQLQFAFPPGAK